jgi:hypothetical protein
VKALKLPAGLELLVLLALFVPWVIDGLLYFPLDWIPRSANYFAGLTLWTLGLILIVARLRVLVMRLTRKRQ